MAEEPKSAGDLSRRLEAELGNSRLTSEEVARRLRILEAAGLVYRLTQVSCQVTQLGQAFYTTLPILQPIQDHAISSQASDVASAELSDYTTELTSELIAASTDTANTVRFEKAIAAALNHLGFSASHLGGPGRTDVLVEAWLGPGNTKTVAIDAKTAASGFKESIEFNVLRDHRKTHKAAISVVVAPGFDARLLSWEKDEGVALITASSLASVVQWQAAFPIQLPELAKIFSVGGIGELHEAWVSVQRRYAIVADVVAKLWRSANSTGHVKASGGALSARDLWLMMLSDDNAASQDEISEVLHFLASPMIGAVELRKNDSYVSTSPPSAVIARLEAMRAAIGGRTGPQITPVKSSADATMVRQSDAGLPNLNPGAIFGNATDSIDPAEVRRWATAEGLNVSQRGRLPNHLVEKYRQASTAGD